MAGLASTTNAVRGLRWILFGLLLALSAALVNVTVTLAFVANSGFGLDGTTRGLFGLVSVAVPIAAAIVAGLALRPLYEGRTEAGNGRRFSVRGALWSALAAGVSAGTYVGTGLLLGFIQLGMGPYLFAHDTHVAAGFLFALTAGLFLFLALRDAGPSDASFLAGAALALGALSALVPVFGFDVGVAPYLLSVVSLVLWVLAYAGTIFYVGRRTAKGGQPVAVG